MTMLDRMRRHKGWLKWSLGLVVLTFVIFYIPDFLRGTTSAGAPNNDVVADVDGHTITAGEFQRRYQQQIAAYQSSYGDQMNIQLLKQLGIDRQILQQLIDERAALTEAERRGITVSDDELARQIFSIPAFQENGRFAGEQRYEAVLRNQRPPMTKAEFEENMRQSLMVERLRSTLTDWLSVPDADVEHAYRQRNEKVKLQLVSVQGTTFRSKVTVTDADVAARYEAHKDEYRVGERRKVRFLLVDMDQVRAKTTVPPAEVEKFYNDNIQNYSTPEQIRARHILFKTEGQDEAAVRKKAEDVLKEVKAGGDFAALAKKYSEDDGSKATGGDLDYFQRGRMVPEFETVAFAMQAGQTSDLVKSPFGFHIIRVEDKKGGTTRTLNDARVEITEQLKFRRAQDAATEQARGLAARIKTGADIEKVAKATGAQTAESGFFLPQEPIPGIGGAPQVAQAAFALADGAASSVLNSPRGPVFITVTGKQAPRVPALDEVKDKVKDDVLTERAKALSLERAQAVVAALKSAKDFAAAAKAQGLEVKDTPLIAREAAIPDVGVSPEVDKVAFALPVGGVSEPIATPTGAVVVRVAEREAVTPEKLLAERGTFRRELETEQRGQFFTAYMGKAKQKMAITIHDDIVKRVVGNQ